ncbi:MAG TPA: biotin/lipoyl-containing protein [Vicinamibacterales bacterium]|nr:biotin/lipoyl-containing protein [Vicinamibacterales bacterium]
MTFEIDLGGRTRLVAVERAGAPGRFRVTLDGVTRVVDAQRFGAYGVSMLFGDDHDATTAVQIAPTALRGEMLAHLGGRAVPVSVNASRTRRSGGDAAGAAHGDHTVVAPMPGRVVRVLVAPGDEVAARQGLVVVEAMKMENELRSPRPGRVKDVLVAAGTSVEAGRVLVVVE